MADLKAFLSNYGWPILLIVVLLTFLPAILTPYMGILGTYATYVVTAIVVGIALFVSNRSKKYVEKVV